MRTVALLALSLVLAPVEVRADSALVAGVGYSDRFGGFANVGLHLRNLMDGALDMQLDHRRGDGGYDLSARAFFRHRMGATALGGDTVLSFGVLGHDSRWQVETFNARTLDLSARIEAEAAQGLRWQLALVHSMADLRISDPALSPVLQQDAGRSAVTWFEAGFTWVSRPDLDILTPGYRISGVVGQGVSSTAGRNWTRARLGGEASFALSGPFVLGISGEGSVISPSGSGRVHALDRIFPDGRAPRGFAWGSAGPRDTVTGDALGGTKQLFSSVEVRAPLPSDGLSVSLFADAGAVWGLAADAGVTADDAFQLRSAAGVALTWSTEFGRLDLSVASPLRSMPSDDLQPLSLRFVAQF